MQIENDVSLAPWTTLGLGGRAGRVATIQSESDVTEALVEPDAVDRGVIVLGGGSNVVIADDGLDALVLRIAIRGVSVSLTDGRAAITAAAGERWDDLVAQTVAEGYSGIECLSGIPGLVGATPIQNVGAYGQEVKDTVLRVRAYDRTTDAVVTLTPAECEFGYRTSRLKTETDRFVVTEVTFGLTAKDESAPIRYPELARALGVEEGETAPLARVRDVVLGLRRGKGMVVDPADPESRSVGSFFINPVLTDTELEQLESRAAEAGSVPRYAAGRGSWKVPAAWLIERAGFSRGHGTDHVRISRRHALALVHAGGGTTRELLALAREIQHGVEARFGVRLTPEPVLLGCSL